MEPMMPSNDSPGTKKAIKKAAKPTKTALRIERAQITVPHVGLSFGSKHHVFIAKLKRGEIWALNHLNLIAKQYITPLLEMWPPNPTTGTKPPKTLVDHTATLMHTLGTEWANLPCYVDTQYLGDPGNPSPSAAKMVFDAARAKNVLATPVTSPLFPPSFQQMIRNAVAADGRGVMFRLPVSFFAFADPATYLNGLVNALGVSRNQVDVLIDLAYRSNLAEVKLMGLQCLGQLPFMNEWRTVTLASGSFPEAITSLSTGSWFEFDRADWTGWLSIAQGRSAAHQRVPSYGDYGVRCGGEPIYIPRPPAPNLRYAVDSRIMVRREATAPGSMSAICTSLVNQPYFSGSPFSQGDSDIAARAATSSQGNGTPEQWIQWCTNHHLELTSLQIRNLPAL
jgi:hypothetical protein